MCGMGVDSLLKQNESISIFSTQKPTVAIKQLSVSAFYLMKSCLVKIKFSTLHLKRLDKSNFFVPKYPKSANILHIGDFYEQ